MASEVPDGYTQTAILISVLGAPAASVIFPALSQKDVLEIAKKLLSLHKVATEEEIAVLSKFRQDWVEAEKCLFLRECLAASLEPETAASVLRQLEAPEISRLRKLSSETAAKLLREESPTLIAAILTQMTSQQAAEVMERLGEPQKTTTLLQLASGIEIDEDLARKLVQRFVSRVERESAQRTSIGGPRRAAEIVNELPAQSAEKSLLSIEEEDPELAGAVRELTFTFEDFIFASSAAMKQICQAADKAKIALALKGASQQLRAQFLKNMSERAAEMLAEEIEALGPTKKSDVAAARKEVVDVARRLQQAGKITLCESSEELVI